MILIDKDTFAVAQFIAKSTPNARMAFGAFLGPIIFGVVLDMAGGAKSGTAWGIAFTATSAVLLLGPVAIWKLVGLRERLY